MLAFEAEVACFTAPSDRSPLENHVIGLATLNWLVQSGTVVYVVRLRGRMRGLIVAGLISTVLGGCASNKAADEPGARIRDTTLTAKDTTNPNDTLPHIRDTVPDST